MSRVLLQYLLPLLLPTVLYLVWWWTLGRRQLAGSGPQPRLTEGPWFWLIICGVALMAGGLVFTALTSSEPAGGRYVAPHVVNGRVVPGHFERD